MLFAEGFVFNSIPLELINFHILFLLWNYHDGIFFKCYYRIYCATFTAVQGVIKVFTDTHEQALNYCTQDPLAD